MWCIRVCRDSRNVSSHFLLELCVEGCILSLVRIPFKAFALAGIGLDKGEYPVNIFFISPRKHKLWVLIRSASARRF